MNTAAAKLMLLAGTAIAESVAVASVAGEPLKTIQLMPLGPVISKRDGRKWNVRDAAHAQAIVDASKASAEPAEIPVDYDHQLMFGAQPGVGGVAPASGWLTNMRVEGDHIVADVDWTARAAAAIAAKEYRYISPVFSFDKASGDVSRILQAALTNFPAITDLAAVASADLDETSMDLKALAKALGLSETATIEEIVAAASAATKAATTAATSLKTLAVAAGLKDDAKPEEIATALAAAKAAGDPDPTAFVPMATFKELQGQVKTLQDTGADTAAAAAVDAAVAAGKVTPATRGYALKLYKADPAAFGEFIGASPTIVKPGATDATVAAAALTEGGELTDQAKTIARSLGVTDEAFKKAGAKQ